MVNGLAEGEAVMIRICLSALLLAFAWATPSLAQPVGGPSGEQIDPLPRDFHGVVRYFGNHSTSVKSIHTFGAGPRANCPRPDGSCPERMGGSLQVELEFDGDVVHGSFVGTGGLRNSKLIGRREGAHCELFDAIDGSTWSGVCDRRNFAGTVTSVDNARVVVIIDFKTVRIDEDNFADRRDEHYAERVRQHDYNMYLAQWKDENSPPEDRISAILELTVFDNPVDPYRHGTMSPAVRRKDRFGTYLEISYTRESNKPGWMRARIKEHGGLFGGRSTTIECVYFWDNPKCVPFSPPPSPPGPEHGQRPGLGPVLNPIRSDDSH